MMIELIKRYIPNKYKAITKRIIKDFSDSFMYGLVRQKSNPHNKNIIFVCKGNVCRSTFAELYLKKCQPTNVNIVSCGLDVDQGGKSPENAIQVAKEFSVDMANTIAKNIKTIEMDMGSQIVAMEFDHYKRLIKEYPNQKGNIVLLKDFLPWPKRLQCNIPDPYGRADGDFRYCFRTIKDALDCMMGTMYDNRKHD